MQKQKQEMGPIAMGPLLAAAVASVAAASCPATHTLMARLNYSGLALAACEDVRGRNGSLIFVTEASGSTWLSLSKRVEFVGLNNASENRYLSYTKAQVMSSPTDLLGNTLLGIHGHKPRQSELSWREVADAVPPIRSINAARICTANRQSGRDACFKEDGSAPTWSGTPDPATIGSGDITQRSGEMRIPKPLSNNFDGEGLLGGDLPILVLDFPLANKSDALWEMVVVPQANNTGREQPVFIRFLYVNGSAATGQVAPSTLYFDSYEYNPSLGCPLGSENPHVLAPDGCARPSTFYSAILDQHFFWLQTWRDEGRMQLSLPSANGTDGKMLAMQASHSLVLDMITRVDSVWPRYGTSPGYDQPGIGADGFQEIFTATMMASLEWGMFPYARAVLENQLEYFIGRRGFVRYRGLEMAQTCRMLTNIAQYYFYTRDSKLLLLNIEKISGIAEFLNRRYIMAKAGQNGQGSLIAGKSGSLPIGNDEADMFFGTVVGYRTELPFISIAAEMWRGLRDCGKAFAAIAAANNHAGAAAVSETMLQNTETLLAELHASMARDAFEQDGSICHPYVAGVPSCGMLFANGTLTTASPRDSEAWRSYSEAFYSGALPDQTIAEILHWHQTHGSCGKQPCHAWNSTNSDFSRMLNGSSLKGGVPSGSGGDVSNGDQIMTFTVHGWGAGLLQADLIEPFLLQYYTISSHAYTRGSWIAPESTMIDRTKPSVSFCTPAELTAPIMLKWLLVWEHPTTHTLWLAKALPRAWLVEGESPVRVEGATTAYGRLSLVLSSKLASAATISANITVPKSWATTPPTGGLQLRLRPPGRPKITSVRLGDIEWPHYNTTSECVIFSSSDLQQEGVLAKLQTIKVKYG